MRTPDVRIHPCSQHSAHFSETPPFLCVSPLGLNRGKQCLRELIIHLILTALGSDPFDDAPALPRDPYFEQDRTSPAPIELCTHI
jgi:hypothetical protein